MIGTSLATAPSLLFRHASRSLGEEHITRGEGSGAHRPYNLMFIREVIANYLHENLQDNNINPELRHQYKYGVKNQAPKNSCAFSIFTEGLTSVYNTYRSETVETRHKDCFRNFLSIIF